MKSIESLRIYVCLIGLTMWSSHMSFYAEHLEQQGITTAHTAEVASLKNMNSILSKT